MSQGESASNKYLNDATTQGHYPEFPMVLLVSVEQRYFLSSHCVNIANKLLSMVIELYLSNFCRSIQNEEIFLLLILFYKFNYK